MENVIQSQLDPNYVPPEYAIPYDVLELPSQGIVYPNKKSTVKVEFLTAFDETVLTSPNISNSNNLLDILIKRKVKELGFDPLDLLVSDRVAILLFLRTTAFGPNYTQLVVDGDGDIKEGEIDLSNLKQKKLTVKPDNDGLFDFTLPNSKKNIKFKFLTGRDELDIDLVDKNYISKNVDNTSNKLFFRMEKQIHSIDGVTDKIKLSNMLKSQFSLVDSRKLRSYIDEIEPGIDFNTVARFPGGGTVKTFLRFNTSFFFPDI